MLIAGDCCRLPSRRGARGREQRGARYGVVVQSDRLHLSTVIIAPTSTNARPAPHRAQVDLGGARTQVLIEQLRAVDVQELGSSVARCGPEAMSEIHAAIDYVFDR